MAVRKRSRLTRSLISLAEQRFYACETCSNQATELVEDVVAPMRLKEREQSRLLKHLTCPNCESLVGAGTLVATPNEEERRQDSFARKFDREHRSDLESFRQFIVKYPMMGAEHRFGILLSGAIGRAQKRALEPGVWYRATGTSAVPNFGPRLQHESTRANRYNQIGQPAWYLARDAKTAAVERLREPRSGEAICIAQISVLEPLSVLDLRSAIWGEDPTRQWILRNVVDRRFISEPTGDNETRPEYRIPQFVGDLARRRGFRGILYDSTRPSAYNNPEAFGFNLVLFDPFPSHRIETQGVQMFREGEYDLERWGLYPVTSEAGAEQ